jgi:hypothetical protein
VEKTNQLQSGDTGYDTDTGRDDRRFVVPLKIRVRADTAES